MFGLYQCEVIGGIMQTNNIYYSPKSERVSGGSAARHKNWNLMLLIIKSNQQPEVDALTN